MGRSFTLALIAGVLCVHVVPAAGNKGAQSDSEEQTLSVRMYDQAGVSAGTLKCAMTETERLFRAAAIPIEWDRPPAEAPEDRGTDMTSRAFQQPDTRRYLVVRLGRGPSATILPGALGYALPFAHTGAHLVIFYDRVESQSRAVSLPVYVILGHALAHEIGHVLLGSSHHSQGGLMQSVWAPASWRLASQGLIAFGREEAEQMRRSLANRDGAKTLIARTRE